MIKLLVVVLCAGCVAPLDETSQEVKGGGNSGPEMTFHGGSVLTASKTVAIFWGSEWTQGAFAGDKISGLDAFFTGYGNSGYARTVTEYSGITGASTYLGHVIDASPAPAKAINSNAAIAEVCKVTNNNPDPAAFYAIYTSTGTGQANYCGWHDWGACSNGMPVQVAYLPNLDGVAGCSADDTWTTHSPGLAAVANVTAHELSEAITDPRGDGWFDSGHLENGDKCIQVYGSGPVTFSNRTTWKLQAEWSNAVYEAGTGLANAAGQPGCITGS